MDKVLLRVAVVFSVEKQNQTGAIHFWSTKALRDPKGSALTVESPHIHAMPTGNLTSNWPCGLLFGAAYYRRDRQAQKAGPFFLTHQTGTGSWKTWSISAKDQKHSAYITVRCFSPLIQLSVETAWHCWACSKGMLCSSGPDGSTPAGLRQPGDPCAAAGVPPMESTALEILPGSCASPL